jgi:hypothetical protein
MVIFGAVGHLLSSRMVKNLISMVATRFAPKNSGMIWMVSVLTQGPPP